VLLVQTQFFQQSLLQVVVSVTESPVVLVVVVVPFLAVLLVVQHLHQVKVSLAVLEHLFWETVHKPVVVVVLPQWELTLLVVQTQVQLVELVEPQTLQVHQ
jgi:hypothetical protein